MLEKEKWTLAQKKRYVESKCHINAIRPNKVQIEALFNLFYDIDQSGFILCVNKYRQITITPQGMEPGAAIATAGVL